MKYTSHAHFLENNRTWRELQENLEDLYSERKEADSLGCFRSFFWCLILEAELGLVALLAWRLWVLVIG